MIPPRLTILRAMPMFVGIKETVLQFLLELAPTRYVSEGDYFFREGDEGDSMFVLLKGRVAVLKRRHPRDDLLYHLRSGACFGEMALMDQCPRAASVIAVEDSNTIELSAGILHDLREIDPNEFAMIHINMGREACQRLRRLEGELLTMKEQLRLAEQNAGARTKCKVEEEKYQ